MKHAEDCSVGVVLTNSWANDEAWSKIIPYMFIYHEHFPDIIEKVVLRQKKLREHNMNTGALVILDNVTVEEAKIDLKLMVELGVNVEFRKPADFAGKRLFAKEVWNLSDHYSHKNTFTTKRMEKVPKKK